MGRHDNYLRIDGYDYVDLYRFSQVEIEKGPLKNPAALDTAPGVQFTIAQPPTENPADFNSSPTTSTSEHIPQQDPSKPNEPPQVQVTKNNK